MTSDFSMDTFASIINPVTTNDFFESYWCTAPIHCPAIRKGRLDDVLTLSDIDRYMQQTHLPAHYFRVAQSDKTYQRDEWSYVQTRRNFDAIHLVDKDRLTQLYNQGATIIIGSAEEQITQLHDFCFKLSQDLGHRIQANVYITPPNAQGLGFHYDTHDVLVLQISGSKHWRLATRAVVNPVQEQPLKPLSQHDIKTKHEYSLQPHDSLYIPRGYVHSATSNDKASVHITLGLHSLRKFDLFKLVADQAMEHDELRSSILYAANANNDMNHLKKSLANFLDSVDMNQLLSNYRSSTLSKHAKLAETLQKDRWFSLLTLEDIDLETQVYMPIGISFTTQKNISDTRFTVNNESISVVNYLVPALKSLLTETPRAVGSVTGLISDEGKLHLVKQALQIGLLRIHAN